MEQDHFRYGPQRAPANHSFLYNRCSQEELREYDAGYKAGSKGLEMDTSKSVAWRSGWSEAQEYELRFTWTA